MLKVFVILTRASLKDARHRDRGNRLASTDATDRVWPLAGASHLPPDNSPARAWVKIQVLKQVRDSFYHRLHTVSVRHAHMH